MYDRSALVGFAILVLGGQLRTLNTGEHVVLLFLVAFAAHYNVYYIYLYRS